MLKFHKLIKILFIILFYVERNNGDSLNRFLRFGREIKDSPGGNCQLPPHPKHGQWFLFDNQQLQPGDNVPANTIITFKCHKDYVYKGDYSVILCLNNGSWNATVGFCEKLCPPLTNTTSTSVVCRKGDRPADCTHPAEGTRADFVCEPFYENRESTTTVRVCLEGTWDQPRHRCEPSCGLQIDRGESLINADCSYNKNSDYPWHVGLYSNKQNPPNYLCGGTLISQNMILTVAHCVTDIRTGALLPADKFSIAVGKYYRKYDDPRDVAAQYRKLKKIYVMPSWRGESLLYQADIAILITDEALQLSRRVQPICMDYDGGVLQAILQKPNSLGVLVGYGNDAGGTPEVLKTIELPHIQYDKCRQELPENFQSYLSNDKFCAGYTSRNIPHCVGGSGGGLIFRNPKNCRYYLAGIASLSPRTTTGDCDKHILFTNVTKYARDILEKSAYHNVAV